MKNIKALILGVITLLVLASCTKHEVKETQAKSLKVYPISITPVDTTMGGEVVFNVLLSDGTGLDYMYIEEVNCGLATGKWEYNEDLYYKTGD